MTAEARLPGVLPLAWSRFRVELRQFYRSPEQAFFIFIMPLLLLVLFSLIFETIEIDGPPDEEPVRLSQYFVAGMIAVGIMASTFNYLAIAVAVEQHDGLLKRLGGTPLPLVSYFLGKAGLILAITVVQISLMLAFGVLVVGVELPSDAGRWGVFAACLVLGTLGFSLIAIGYTRFIPNVKSAGAIVLPPYLTLQFISGVFFVFDDIPPVLQGIASVFPLRWLAQGLRYVFLPDWFQTQEPGGGWDLPLVLGVLAAWTLVGLVMALRLFRWNRGIDG